MKTIYKNIYGAWQDIKPTDEEIIIQIDVEDAVNANILNTPYYFNSDYTEIEYQTALVRINKNEAIKYLQDTDYVTTQWADEISLNIPHHRTEAEYLEILQKREQSREYLRQNKDID